MIAPASEQEAASFVQHAAGRRASLSITGGGTRAGLHAAQDGAEILTTRGLTGVTLYEPSEMVISARAGTPLSEVEAVLAEKGQRLAFEPMDHRLIYGSAGAPTIGGLAACNISGPRRIMAGAARDSMIGVRFINGKGEIIRSGGRVMKNVTGLDLVKLQAGAMGRLGLLTEVTFKVQPKPAAGATLLLRGLDDRQAVAALSAGLGSPYEVSGAAHRPASAGREAETWLRIENVAFAVDYRFGRLAALLAPYGRAERIDGAAHEALWRSIRDVEGFAAQRERIIWRVLVKPGDGPALVARVKAERDVDALYDWGGGLVWLATPVADDGGAALIRGLLQRLGGHARLERGREWLGNRVSWLQPQDPAVAQLEAGIARSVDPAGVFSALPATMGAT